MDEWMDGFTSSPRLGVTVDHGVLDPDIHLEVDVFTVRL